MKKSILTLLMSFTVFFVNAQIGVYKPYRTNGNVMVADSALFVGKLKIASYPTFSLQGYADKAGQGFGLNITNNRLNVRSATSSTLEFPTLTEVNSLISSSVPNLQQVTTAGNSTTLGAVFGGNMTIGTGTSATINQLINKGLSGGTVAYGTQTAGTIASTVTSQAILNMAVANTVASPFTLNNVMGFRFNQGTVGAGSTINNQYGFYVEALSGATNNYGYYGGIAKAANRWNLFMGGTADNYFVGNIGIGVAAPLAYLHLKPGTATSNTAPIKLTSGPLNTSPEVGAIEFLTDRLYFTKTTGTTREQLSYLSDLSTYAPINNPALTGVPTAPTASAGTNTTQIATAAFVNANSIQNQTATPQSGGFNVTATTFHQGGIQTNEFVRYMRGSYGVDIQSPASLSTYYTQLLQALNGTLALTVQPGDIEITDATKGIILKSPNGTRWRVTVGDTGVLTTTSIP